MHRAAELGHGDQRDVFHAIAQVLIKGRERLAELRQIVGELAVGGLSADLVDVRVPAADIGERHFHADVGLDQLRDLLQAFAEAAVAIVRAIGRHVGLLLDGLHDLDRVERLFAGAMQRRVQRIFIHALEGGRAARIVHLKIVQAADRDGIVVAAQRARQVIAQADGAQRRCRAGFFRQRPIQPAVGSAFEAGRAGLHVILRVEMRARGIGRAYRVHDRQMPRVEHRLERRERRMQSEESVQIDG